LPLVTAPPTASISSPSGSADGASSSAPPAEGGTNSLAPVASPTESPSALPIAATVGELYLAITAAAESLTPSGLDQIRSQLAQHLGVGEANIVLNVLSGSIILKVTISGERVDGAWLAQLLETDVTAGRLSSVVVGYAPRTSHVFWREQY
jgi:hypothetical protein